MIQKTAPSQPDTSTATAGGNDSLIPRPECLQNSRAKLVEINLKHSIVNASMDLTPTVGSGITSLQKLEAKKSLYINTPNIPRFYSCNQGPLHSSFQEYKEFDSVAMASLSDHGKKKIHPINLVRNSESAYNRPILETPVKMFKENVIPIVETPVHSSVLKTEPFTPSKQLANQLHTLDLKDSLPDAHWYQIDNVLQGFTDIW